MKTDSQNSSYTAADCPRDAADLQKENALLRRALHQEQARMRSWLQETQLPHVSLTPEGHIFNCNTAFLTLLERNRHDLLGRNLQHLIPEHEQNASQPLFEALRNDEIICNREICLQTNRGLVLPVEISGMRAVSSQEPEQIFCIVRERSFEQENNREAKELLNFYHKLFADSPSCVLLVEMQTRVVVDANRNAQEFYGLSPVDLGHVKLDDLTAANPAPEFELPDDSGPHRWTSTHKHADGGTRHVDIASAPVYLQGTRLRHAVVNDVTDRRRSQEELASAYYDVTQAYHKLQRVIAERRAAQTELLRQEATLQSIISAAPLGVGLVEGDTIQWTNLRFTRLLGYRPDALNGIHCTKLFRSPDAAKNAHNQLKKGLYAKGLGQVETRLQTKTGKLVDVLLTASQLDLENAADSVILAAMDISELKNAETELRNAKEAAESANKAKTEFLTNISHEIRTPLNGVLGMLQLLKGQIRDKEQSFYLELALDSSNGLLAILNDILDFTILDAGKLKLCRKDFDLQLLLDSLYKMFQDPIHEKGLRFVMEIDPSVPKLLVGDVGRLRQILFNLLGNAVKFTHQGEVRLEIHPLQSASENGSARLLFTISDTGVGIPPKKLDQMLSPFTQGDSSNTRSYSGAGLGLGIVSRLVTLFDGSLILESQPNLGTTAYVSLPFRMAAPIDETCPLAEEFRTLAVQPRVLVAEDNRVNQLNLELMLKKLHFTSTSVSNGRAVLDILNKEHFDIVLMNVHTPVSGDMDGLETTRRIRSGRGQSIDPQIPVIAVSDQAAPFDKDQAVRAGINGFLTKPVALNELARTLFNALAQE